MMSRKYPFELVIKDKNNKELFIDNVEKILTENLQCENSFGCKIINCHTHVGSKKHLSDFIEAELLFHNSYYNKGFAYCTTKLLARKINTKKNIIIVGYETFGELYIRETVEMLKKFPGVNVDYCIAETVGNKFRIRNTIDKIVYNEETFFAFIVPINTTLTTHDKLMGRFIDYIKIDKSKFNEENSINIGLIMLGYKNNDYWQVKSEQDRTIELCKSRKKELVHIADKIIYYFAQLDAVWYESNRCEFCFPDLYGKKLIDENAIFEVNRASVVPMLQLGIETIPEPLDIAKKTFADDNIFKLIVLNKYLIHQHVIRGGNHYQYYFDTQKFFEKALKISGNKSLKSWLESVKQKINKNIQTDKITYNFIVSPRHYSNAGFVQYVNDIVFDGGARILYFDVTKEYRGNVKAKYSDLAKLVENIKNSKEESELCFHYVDDMIFSGTNFLRTKNFLNTLIKDEDYETRNSCKKKVFKSVILFVGRNSTDSKKWFINDINMFFEYTHLSISPMRNHEDACTLCKLRNSYKKIKKECSTNELSSSMQETIKVHKPIDIVKINHEDYKAVNGETLNEKRARVLIRHLLTERLNNNWWFADEVRRGRSKKDKVINNQKVDDIYYVIDKFYNKLHSEMKQRYYSNKDCLKLLLISENDLYSEQDYKIALIKVISRPFFCYNIRQKQAALKFCLHKIDELLNKSASKQNSSILISLINALADLNSVFLIRVNTINRLMKYIEEYNDVELKKQYIKAIKKVVNMSSDDNRSLLLECILTHKSEEKFFKQNCNDNLLIDEETRKALYIENNIILVSGFKDIIKNNIDVLSQGDVPYYLNNFFQIFKLNTYESDIDFSKVICSYKKIYNYLRMNQCGRRVLEEIAIEIGNLFNNNTVRMFFIDDTESIVYDKYYLISKETDAKFYSTQHIDKLEHILKTDPILKTLYVYDNTWIIKIMDKNIQPLYISFEQNDLSSMFNIKILLTLRNLFVKMLRNLNVLNEIAKMNIERKTKAVKISKANSHLKENYYQGRSNLLYCRSNFDKDKIDNEILKRQYDKYLLVLANEYIAYNYRNLILRPDEINISSMRCKNWLKLFFEEVGFKNNGNFSEYEIYVPRNDKSLKETKVTIRCDLSYFDKKKFIFIKRSREVIPSLIFLIFVFAANAGYHIKKGENDTILYVESEDEYIVFKNNIVKDSLDDDERKHIKQNAAAKMNTPPWEFKANEQSITLWFLTRYFQVLGAKSSSVQNNKLLAFYSGDIKNCIYVDVTNNEFIVKVKMLQNIKEEEEIQEWEF